MMWSQLLALFGWLREFEIAVGVDQEPQWRISILEQELNKALQRIYMAKVSIEDKQLLVNNKWVNLSPGMRVFERDNQVVQPH